MVAREQIPAVSAALDRGRAGFLRGTCDGGERYLAYEAEATIAIPCHYEMFKFNTESTDEFVAASAQLNQAQHLMRCGQPAGKAHRPPHIPHRMPKQPRHARVGPAACGVREGTKGRGSLTGGRMEMKRHL